MPTTTLPFMKAALITLFGVLLAATGQAATLTVTSSADSGVGTLRQALTDAVDGDTIDFDPAANPITVNSALNVNRRVTISGVSQVVQASGTGFDVFYMTSGSSGSTLSGMALLRGRFGIWMTGCSNVSVLNCRIGIDYSDANQAAASCGIRLDWCNNVRIGAPGQGNVISWSMYGIYVSESSTNTIIQSNYIGTNAAGTSDAGYMGGIVLTMNSTGTLIGGNMAAGEGNVISGHNEGIYTLNGSHDNIIAGNIIGLNATQTAAIPNFIGLRITTPNHIIGQTFPGHGNVIAGNQQQLYIDSTSGCVIRNNRIGNNQAEQSFSNQSVGILLMNATGNVIGGDRAVAGESNVISGMTGSGFAGLLIHNNCSGNVVSGNYIGTNSSGTAAVPNYYGISVISGNNVIGGTEDGGQQRGNVISGNTYGLFIQDNAGLNTILGNRIGLNAAGNAALPNNTGIYFYTWSGATAQQIGDGTAAGRNVIAGNSARGIYLNSGGSVVSGNYLGVSADGSLQIRNTTEDLNIPGSGNRIENNLLAGSATVAGGGNTLTGNRIGVLADNSRPPVTPANALTVSSAGNFIGLPGGPGNLIANAGRGIYLSSAGADFNGFYANTITAFATEGIGRVAGANQDKAAPVVTSGLTTLVLGTAGAGDYVELFKAEPGAGTGGSLMLVGTTTANGAGNWSVVPSGIRHGEYVCALATDSANNTSLFSANHIAYDPTPTSTVTPTYTYTATPTITPTSTSTATPTITPTVTPTYTSTDTPTATPTLTITPTVTPTCTPTDTPTASPTVTLTATTSATPTVTPTVSPTHTITPTVTLTPTFTVTGTATPTLTVTPTQIRGDGTIRAFPIPARDWVRFFLSMEEPGRVEISVYNLAGERVAELAGSLPQGPGELVWECGALASGIYLARVRINGEQKRRFKLAVVR